MISRQNVSDFLRHPFVILVATATISCSLYHAGVA